MAPTVDVTLGPLDAEAVVAFVSEAEELLGWFPTADALRDTFTPAVADGVRTYLTEWRAAARNGEEFTWRGAFDTSAAEFLLYAVFVSVEQLRRSTGGEPLSDPRSDLGRPFLRMLIARLHGALKDVPGVDDDRLAYLAASWPSDLFER